MDVKVERFEKLAKKRWEYLKSGNAKAGNRCFNQMSAIIDELEKDDRVQELVKLLNHSEDSVRYECAAKLLPYYPQHAIYTLNELTNQRGHLSFVASQTMRWWTEKQNETEKG